MAQIADAVAAAGAAPHPDDALDGLHVPEAPLLECVLQIHQFLGQFVGIEMQLGVPVDLLPDRLDAGMGFVRVRRVAIEDLGWNRIAAPREEPQRLIIEVWRVQGGVEFLRQVLAVPMRPIFDRSFAPSLNSTSLYCHDWKPEERPRAA